MRERKSYCDSGRDICLVAGYALYYHETKKKHNDSVLLGYCTLSLGVCCLLSPDCAATSSSSVNNITGCSLPNV